MANTQDGWTPYGLEAIRIGHLRRRRALALLIALGLAMLWFFSFESTTSTRQDIFVNGQKQSSIEIDFGDTTPKKDGPVTVALSPGRVTRATAGEAGDEAPVSAQAAPAFDRGSPIPFSNYLILYGPYVLIGGALWLLAKRGGKHHEVNYGIYKGAMPLEMITASASRHVRTTRHAKQSLFGKREQDHLPREVLRVERVAQEADG